MLRSATPTDKPIARRHAFRLLGLALIPLTLALALPAGASAFISTGDGGWFEHSPGTPEHLLDGVFVDVPNIWAVGGDATQSGFIGTTTDGGATCGACSLATRAAPRSRPLTP